MEKCARPKRLAILLCSAWRGGMLRNALHLARLLVNHDWDRVGRIQVVLGLLRDGDYDWSKVHADIADTGRSITVRRFEWTKWSAEAVYQYWPYIPRAQPTVTEVVLPCDRAHNFLDCDAWILFSAPVGYFVSLRPYAVYCADLIQRYVPQISDSLAGEEQPEQWRNQVNTFLAWRGARCVFATTPKTVRDVIEYAGVPVERTLLVPTLVDPLGAAASLPRELTSSHNIVWVTNLSQHKNHSMALAALQIYYDQLAGTLPLIVTGEMTEQLDPQSGSVSFGSRAFRQAPPVVLERTRFAGAVSDAAYLRLIGSAAVVWHNVIIDNGSFVAFDAARAGRHFVSSDYPQMRYLCERYGVAPIWHPAGDPIAAANALSLAERRFMNGEQPTHLPRGNAEGDLVKAYGALLDRLLNDVNTPP